MKNIIISIFLLLSMMLIFSCKNNNLNHLKAHQLAQIDSMAMGKISDLRAQLVDEYNERFNNMAQEQADSILAAQKAASTKNKTFSAKTKTKKAPPPKPKPVVKTEPKPETTTTTKAPPPKPKKPTVLGKKKKNNDPDKKGGIVGKKKTKAKDGKKGRIGGKRKRSKSQENN